MKRFLVTLIATYFLINLSAANKAVYNIMDYGAIADTTMPFKKQLTSVQRTEVG